MVDFQKLLQLLRDMNPNSDWNQLEEKYSEIPNISTLIQSVKLFHSVYPMNFHLYRLSGMFILENIEYSGIKNMDDFRKADNDLQILIFRMSVTVLTACIKTIFENRGKSKWTITQFPENKNLDRGVWTEFTDYIQNSGILDIHFNSCTLF